MDILYIILLSLSLSWVFSEFLGKLKFPRVLAPILVGVLLGIKPIKDVLIGKDATTVLSTFSDIGLIFLMFYVGFELNVKDMMKTGKRSFIISILCSVCAFASGFLVGKLFGLSTSTAIIMGASLSVTAEAIAVNVLEELSMLHSSLGNIIVAAGIIDNIFELIILAVIVYVTKETTASSPLLILPFLFILGLAILLIYRSILPKTLLIAERYNMQTSVFMISVILALLTSLLSEYLGFGFVMGALIAGVMMNSVLEHHRKSEFRKGKKQLFTMSLIEFKELREKMKQHDFTVDAIKTTAFGFLVPFFFIWIGLHVDLSSFLVHPLLVVVYCIAAFAGKVIGGGLGNWIAKGSVQEGMTIGWALNARGSVELVFAELARANNIITNDIFSVIVFMTVFTTLFSPVMFKYLVLKQKISKKVFT